MARRSHGTDHAPHDPLRPYHRKHPGDGARLHWGLAHRGTLPPLLRPSGVDTALRPPALHCHPRGVGVRAAYWPRGACPRIRPVLFVGTHVARRAMPRGLHDPDSAGPDHDSADAGDAGNAAGAAPPGRAPRHARQGGGGSGHDVRGLPRGVLVGRGVGRWDAAVQAHVPRSVHRAVALSAQRMPNMQKRGAAAGASRSAPTRAAFPLVPASRPPRRPLPLRGPVSAGAVERTQRCDRDGGRHRLCGACAPLRRFGGALAAFGRHCGPPDLAPEPGVGDVGAVRSAASDLGGKRRRRRL
mmetsp:Transcript_28027/g.66901  ORF Transcript_28027/g.66901 Transcript_28027/m.66901 type:complete len:299 (-) Transcript_28027:306-1202(-)